MPEVTVAIPTFQRPQGLLRLLEALARLDTTASVTVLVADNDTEKHEGFALCEAVRSKGYRWPLRSIVVAQRGIAAVRNALVENALADPKTEFVAMLDDDEWPEPHWLSALLAEQAKTNADALQGSILFAFDQEPEAWTQSFDGMTDIRHISGPVDMLQGAGNILVTRAALERLARPWFDPASSALGGGEDFDFFMRLKRSGATFAWSDEAVAHSSVPDTRITMGWALKRAYSIGNSDMRVFLKYQPAPAARAAEAARIVGAFLFAPLLFLANAFDAARRADALRRLWRAAGKCAALFGHRYDEYAVIHGRYVYSPAPTTLRTDFDTRIVEIGFVLVLLLIMVGLEPFDARTAAAIAAKDAATAAGDFVRQVAFLSTFGLIAYGAWRKRGLKVVGAVPVLVGLLLAWCFLSAFWADEPLVVTRRAVLAAIFVFSMLMAVDALGAARTLAIWRNVTAAIILGDIAASLLIHAAVHQPDDLEAGLAGAWRGLHSHKNMAGSVAAAAVVMFFFFALETKRRSDILLCVASAFFLVMTRSKSSMGLLPLALAGGFLYRAAWRSKLDRAIAAIIAALLLIAAGLALALEWDAISRFLEDPQLFTGRAAIWAAELQHIEDHPLLGAGFGTFGNTGARSPIYHYVGPGWVAQIGEGHSGYLEMLVTIGGIGFIIGMIGLLIMPFLEFWKSNRTDANFNALLFTLFVFNVLHNFMESDFIQVTSAQWGQILLILGLLHVSAREMRERGQR